MAVALTTVFPSARVSIHSEAGAARVAAVAAPATLSATTLFVDAGVRAIRPWTQTIATTDLVLTRAHRMATYTRATGEQWAADTVLATILGVRADTSPVVLWTRYEGVLHDMTYGERDQCIASVRASARVPEHFRPFMERARRLQQPDGSWPILDERPFQLAVLDCEAVDKKLLSKWFYKLCDQLPRVWAIELESIYRSCTSRGLTINLAEAELAVAEFQSHRRWVLPYQIMQRLLGIAPPLVERHGCNWVIVRFNQTVAALDAQVQRRVAEIVEQCTSFAIDIDLRRLQTLMTNPPTTPIDKVSLYRRVLELPEALPTRAVRERMLGALRRASVAKVVAYRKMHLLWVGRLNGDYCRRARDAMTAVERTGQHITDEAFKRIVLDAPDSMSHDTVLDRYTAFRAEVFTSEEKTFLDAAHLACTGYMNGRCGKTQHAEFMEIVTARAAFAEQLAEAIQSGSAEQMEAAAYEAALMAQGRPTRAQSAHHAYRGFLSHLDHALRQQFIAWGNTICQPHSELLITQHLQSAIECALEVQERIARGGAYMSVADFQYRVMAGCEALDIGSAYYQFRDPLHPTQQELLDAAMLAATGRPPHFVGRYPPRHAHIPLAGLAQHGIEIARALCREGTSISPTDFYRQLFGNTVEVTELRRLFALVQRQAPRGDQILLDAALGLATHALWINGGIVPIAHLEPRGVNGNRRWWILRDDADSQVTSVVPEYLDAVIAQTRELRPVLHPHAG